MFDRAADFNHSVRIPLSIRRFNSRLAVRHTAREIKMFNKTTTRLTALALSAMITADQAFAMAWFPGGGDGGGHGGGHGSGPGTSTGVPELDASGGIAVLALLVSVALVLFNRSRNR